MVSLAFLAADRGCALIARHRPYPQRARAHHLELTRRLEHRTIYGIELIDWLFRCTTVRGNEKCMNLKTQWDTEATNFQHEGVAEGILSPRRGTRLHLRYWNINLESRPRC